MLRAVVGVLQGAKERGAFFEGESFGAGGWFYAGLGQGGAQLGFGIVGLEIVPERLALLSEGELQEVDKAAFQTISVEAEFFLPRRHGEAEGGGVYFGRRCERAGGQSEKFFDAGVKLGGSGEQSVVAGARLGGDAVGDFALHQDDDGIEIFRVVEQAQKNVGRDVVGKVADDFDWLGTKFNAGAAEAGLGSEEGIEIDGKDVGFDDLDVGEHAEVEAELGGEDAVELDGDEAVDAFGEEGSENAASGADFEDGVLGDVAEGVDNLSGEAVGGEEMLS